MPYDRGADLGEFAVSGRCGYMVEITSKRGTKSFRFCDSVADATALVKQWVSDGFKAEFWDM